MKKLLIVLCLLVIYFVGCQEEKRKDYSFDNSENTTKVLLKTSEFARIENASPTQLNHMKAALNRGYNINEMYVVKSRDFNNIYFVGSLVNNKIAIWAMGGTKSKISLTYSMNSQAYKVSGLGMGTTIRDPISLDDDGARLLMRYLETK